MGGRHKCTVKDVEIVPIEKIVTILPEDTFGIRKVLSVYRVETTFKRIDEHTTGDDSYSPLHNGQSRSQALQPVGKQENRPRDDSDLAVNQEPYRM
jgi:hypothetical protein